VKVVGENTNNRKSFLVSKIFSASVLGKFCPKRFFGHCPVILFISGFRGIVFARNVFLNKRAILDKKPPFVVDK
jgi:hypothetical protein